MTPHLMQLSRCRDSSIRVGDIRLRSGRYARGALPCLIVSLLLSGCCSNGRERDHAHRVDSSPQARPVVSFVRWDDSAIGRSQGRAVFRLFNPGPHTVSYASTGPHIPYGYQFFANPGWIWRDASVFNVAKGGGELMPGQALEFHVRPDPSDDVFRVGVGLSAKEDPKFDFVVWNDPVQQRK